MPTLKQLTCRLEWMSTSLSTGFRSSIIDKDKGSRTPLDEFKTKYRDGQVETNIAVPDDPMLFQIHLTSRGYIAPGLAMFVYIDGEYQCNRNRHNLIIPDGTTTRKHTEIDFQVRQKEVMLTDGSLWGKPWRFEKIMAVPDHTEELANCAPYDGEYLGTIEVVVLRCNSSPRSHPMPVGTAHFPRYEANSKRAIVKPAAGDSSENGSLFDGAVDTDATHSSQQWPGLDGNWDDWKPKGKPDNRQQWGWEMTGSETGEFKPMSQGRYKSRKSRSKSRSSERQAGADDRAQSHVVQSGPAGSPAVVINSEFTLEDSITCANESVTHPAAGSQTEARPTVRSVAQSNHSSHLRGRKKHDEKGGNTSNDPGGEAWNVPLPFTEASNVDWTKPRRNSDAGSKIDWSPVDSKKDMKTAEWVNSLSTENKDEGHDTDNDHSYCANNQSSQARRNTNRSQSRARNDSRSGEKQWSQGADRQANHREPSGEWSGPNGSAKKDSGWNADKTWNETSRQPSWEKEPKQTSPPVRTTTSRAWGPAGHVSPKSPRLQSKSHLSQAFPGAWPRSRTPSPARQEQTQRWSSPQATLERPQTQPARQEQTQKWSSPQGEAERPQIQPPRREETHRCSSPQDAVERPLTLAVQPSWGGSTPEGPPKPKVGIVADSSGYHTPTGWPNIPPKIPAEVFHHPGNQIHNTPPASVPGSRKLSISRSMRLGIRPVSKTTSKSRARSKAIARPRANTTASHNKSSESLIDKLRSEFKGSKDLQLVFDPDATDSPLYTVPEEVIKRKNVTHQVNAGRTASYNHKMSTPNYLDSHDDPYAVFIFRYRSKAALERMLNIKVIESEESERQRLMGLSKDELIEQYLKAKAQADLKANMGNSDELDEATEKLGGIQLGHEENDALEGNGEGWGGCSGEGSSPGGWNTGRQPANSGNNIPSWGGNDEQNQNYLNNGQGNGGPSWEGSHGRDRSRSTHYRSEHSGAGNGGNGSFAWGGDPEMNQNHLNNNIGNGGQSRCGDHGRDQSRSTHHRSEHHSNGPCAWGGTDEKSQNHSNKDNNSGGLSWDGDNGRDRSRSAHNRSEQRGVGNGGNAPLAWGGEQGRHQSQSSIGNTTAFRSANSNHGRYSSRDINPRQDQGSGWAGDRNKGWGGETANNGRRSGAGGNGGRVAEADVDWRSTAFNMP